MNSGKSMEHTQEAALGLEAAQWLLDLSEPQPAAGAAYPTPAARNEAFFEWLESSPHHLRVFFETVETHRRLSLIDPQQMIKVEEIFNTRGAEVIRLYGKRAEAAKPRAGSTGRGSARRTLGTIGIAAAVVLGVTAVLYQSLFAADAYTTAVGEQRQAKLEDGSFVYLNTDSRVEIDFSEQVRAIRLVRGEALFVVEKDSRRPFIVHAGSTTVRAVGTQFNVRRRPQGTEVAVIEGIVQVATPTAAPEYGPRAPAVSSRRLGAGENVRITQSQVSPQKNIAVTDTLAWRQRRLVFHDTGLAEVAEEFNRYNRTKIRVEGEAAQIQLSGIFDADRPQALMLYAARNAQLAVEPQGSDWVIRAR